MAAPNIASANTITGKNYGCAVGISRTDLVPAVATGACARLTFLYLANVDGIASVDGTVELYDSSANTYYKLGNTLPVPPDATINFLEKGPLYLEEGDKVVVTASVAGDLEAVASGEVIT